MSDNFEIKEADVSEEELKKLFFANGIPEEYEEYKDFMDYVKKLGSHTIGDINNELIVLEDEKLSISAQLKDVAYTNYKTFIETYQCTRNISDKLQTAENKLKCLMEDFPNLTLECENFVKDINEIKADRKLNTSMLTNSAQILQFLELPQLMLTCIRHERYENAFQLAAYSRNLASKHGDIVIVKNVADDVERYWFQLLQHLINQLRTDIQLPKCLHVMGYLRRMGIFSEIELKLKFLQARSQWLNSLMNNLPKQNSNEYLSKVIEFSRIHIFNIVTQYRAVFADDDGLEPNNMKSLIFYAWLNNKVTEFLFVIEKELPNCSPNSLDSLYGQCMYFGLSFGRIGTDFRGLVQDSFGKVVANHFEVAVNAANKKLQLDMERFSVSAVYSLDDTLLLAEMDPTVQENPAIGLLEFYPYAEYCNGVLTAFNNLRLCSPVNVIILVTRKLQESLKNASFLLSEFYRREKLTFSEKDQTSFKRLCNSYANQFIPFIQQCLSTIFVPSNVASYFGLSLSEVEEQGLGYLDMREIVNVITHILPTAEVIPESINYVLPTSEVIAETISYSHTLSTPEVIAETIHTPEDISETIHTPEVISETNIHTLPTPEVIAETISHILPTPEVVVETSSSEL